MRDGQKTDLLTSLLYIFCCYNITPLIFCNRVIFTNIRRKSRWPVSKKTEEMKRLGTLVLTGWTCGMIRKKSVLARSNIEGATIGVSSGEWRVESLMVSIEEVRMYCTIACDSERLSTSWQGRRGGHAPVYYTLLLVLNVIDKKKSKRGRSQT